MRSNNALKAAAGLALISSLFFPLAVAAQNPDRPQPALYGNNRGFCALVARGADGRLGQRLGAQQQKLDEKRAERDNRLTERRQQRDERLSEVRANSDARKADHIDKLLELAQDDGQKQAVAIFQAAVDAALSARRSAVDEARQEFKNGLDAAIAARKAAVDAATGTFTDALVAAETKAKTDCDAAGSDPAQVRETLRASVESARTQLRSALQAAEKIGPQAGELVQTRNEAFRAAQADFKAALEQARTDLKAAFVSESDDETAESDDETAESE